MTNYELKAKKGKINYEYPDYVLKRAREVYGLTTEIDDSLQTQIGTQIEDLQTQIEDLQAQLQAQIEDLQAQLQAQIDDTLYEVVRETLLRDTVAVLKSGNHSVLKGLRALYNNTKSDSTFTRMVKIFWGDKTALVAAAMNRIDESKMVIDRNDYLKIVEKVDQLDSEDASITEIKKMLEAMNA